MRGALLAAMLLTMVSAPAARADDPLPPVADVLLRTRAVMNRKPDHAVCKIVVDSQLLDRSGKVEHDEHREGEATLTGDDQDIDSTRVVRDGKPMSADELAAERDKARKQRAKRTKGGDDDFDLSPLAAKNAPSQSFELVRRELLWGRPAWVLKVKAARASPQLANGTLWIDAERYVELKGELTPAGMPAHADWVKVQEQYTLGPSDLPMPSLMHIEGAGHMLFMHKQFRSTLRWSGCR